MKRYKLCDSCIYHQYIKIRTNLFTLRTDYFFNPICNKSLTPTIRNHQEHCPHYETNPSPRKTKKK